MKFLLLLLFFVACTLTPELKVNDYISQMKAKLIGVEGFIKSSAVEIQSHEQILKKWPNPAGKKILDKMTQSRMNTMQSYYRFKEDFQGSILQEKITVQSNDPSYEMTKQEMKNLEDKYSILTHQMASYDQSTQELARELAKRKIYLVDGVILNETFLTNLNTGKKELKIVKDELIDFSFQAKPAQKKLVEELGLIVEKMENNVFRFQRLYTASIKEIGKNKKFATPGMKSYNWKEVQAGFLKNISDLKRDFDQKALPLKPAVPKKK